MNSNKNLHNSLSKKMLAKKLLLATLAATSTLTALDASADSAVVVGGAGQLLNSSNIYINGAGSTAAKITNGHDLYLAFAGTHVFNAPDVTLKEVNALGNTSTLNVSENTKVESIINKTDDATITKANTSRNTTGAGVANQTDKLTAAYGIGTNPGEQIKVQFSAANKIFEVTGTDVSGLKEVDFNSQDSTFRISGDKTVISDKVSFKSNGTDNGIVEINATGVELSAKFNVNAGDQVKTIKVSQDKSAIQKVDVKLSGSLELAKDASYDIDAGKKFEGAGAAGAVTFLDETSKLNLKGGNIITGNVGNDATKGTLTHTGKASTIQNDVRVKSLKLDSKEEALIITGTLDEKTVITATDGAILELQNIASKITPFVIQPGVNNAAKTTEQIAADVKVAEAQKDFDAKTTAAKTAAGKAATDAAAKTAADKAAADLAAAQKALEAANDAKVTADKAATTATTATVVLNNTGVFETTDTLTQNVHFKKNDAVLKVKEEKQLKGVTTETTATGKVVYSGDAVIAANIGTDKKALESIATEKEKGKITINEGIKVYGQVLLTKKEQKINIGKGALVSSVFAQSGTTDHEVNVEAGASLGDVTGFKNSTGTVNFTGGGKFIGKEYVATKFKLIKGEGKEFLATQEETTFTNLITEKDVTIDAGGNRLIFASDSTPANNTTSIADGTNVILPLTDNALNVKDQEVKNIGQTNIRIDYAKLADKLKLTTQTYKQLTDKNNNKSGDATKLITGIKSKDVYDKFTLNESKTYNLNTEFKDNALTIDPTFNTSFIEGTKAMSIIDQNAKLTAQDVLLFEMIETKGQDEAIREVSAMNADTGGKIILGNISIALQNQINNQMNNRNVSSGENYNEMGIAAFVAPFMSGGTSKLNGQVAGNKHSSSGANFGATFGLNDDKTHFGLAITIAKSDTKYKDAQEGSKLKSDTKAFTIFGNHSFANNLVVQGIFTFGATDHKANQLSRDKTLSGKYSSKFSSVLAKLGYNINAGDSVNVMPYVGLSYDSIKDDSYKLVSNVDAKDTEKRDVAGKTTNSCTASIGTKFSGKIEYDETHLVPFADLSFGYNFGKKASAKEVSLGNLSITPEYATHDKSSIRASLGAEANMQNGLNVTLMGGMDMLGSKTTVYSGSLKLGYQF